MKKALQPLFTSLTLLALLLPAVQISAQKDVGYDLYQSDETESSPSLLKKLKPRAGLFYSPALAMGEPAKLFGFSGAGFEAFAYGNVPLPALKKFGLYLDSGLSIGLYAFGGEGFEDPLVKRTDLSASQTLVNFNLPVHVAYPLKVAGFAIRPYYNMGLGFSLSSTSAQTSSGKEEFSASDVGATWINGLGAGYMVNRQIEVLVEINHVLYFETVNGSYLMFKLGSSYSF